MRARVPIAALAALLVALVVAAGASAKPAPPAAGQNAAPTDVRAAFFTNWSRYARGYTVKQIPAAKLNVLDYAFGAPTAAGTCGLTDPWSDYEAPTGADQSVDGVADDSANPNQHLYGNFNQLLKLKAVHPNLRVVMSIGGWTGSKYFSDVAATAATRAGVRRLLRRPAPQGQPAVRSGDDLAAVRGRPRRGRGRLRRDRHRLGVPRHRPRQRRRPLARRRPQRDPAAPGVPPAARRVRRDDREALPPDRRPPGRQRELERELGAGSGRAARSTGSTCSPSTSTAPGTRGRTSTRRSPSTAKSPPVGGGAIMSTWSTAGTVDYYLANGVSPDKLVVGVPFYGKEYVGVPGHEQRPLPAARRGAVERLADLSRPRRHGPRRREPGGDRADGGLADVEHRQRRQGPERLHALLRRRGEGAVALQPDAERRHVHQLRRPTCRSRSGAPRPAGQAPRPLGLGDLE